MTLPWMTLVQVNYEKRKGSKVVQVQEMWLVKVEL